MYSTARQARRGLTARKAQQTLYMTRPLMPLTADGQRRAADENLTAVHALNRLRAHEIALVYAYKAIA